MHSHNNGFKTALLMGSMVGMMLLIGGLLSVSFRSSIFIWIMGLFGLASVAYTYWNSDKLALRSMNAYPVSREEVPVLYDIVEELSFRAGQPMPALYVAPTMTPNAFATGRNPQNAAVCCTEGILQLLDEREMRGVLGHELMHVYNRDILTSSVAAGIPPLSVLLLSSSRLVRCSVVPTAMVNARTPLPCLWLPCWLPLLRRSFRWPLAAPVNLMPTRMVHV